MKTQILTLALIGAFCSVAYSQAHSEKELYEKLVAGKEKEKTLETILKAPEKYSPVILFLGAAAAHKEKRLEDSGFLFYAAQLRARFDQQCFPPTGTGANSPFVLFGALSQQIGAVVNPAIMADPKAYRSALARIQKWRPQAPDDYDPGYEYSERKTEDEARKGASKQRAEFVNGMTGLSKLCSTTLNTLPRSASRKRIISLSTINGPAGKSTIERPRQ